jgi:hypothetical protein
VRDGKLHCPEFPEAVKLVEVPHEALRKKLAHLSLHHFDLMFAAQCLAVLAGRDKPGEPDIVRRGLWHAALVATYKCFGGSRARASLKRDDIYDEGDQRDTFDYFKHLRDKHIVHDDNDHAQAHVGAVLEKLGVEPKVTEALCFTMFTSTVDQQNTASLRCVVDKAIGWVESEIDTISDAITAAMNEMRYAELDALPGIGASKPTNDTIAITRTTPAK